MYVFLFLDFFLPEKARCIRSLGEADFEQSPASKSSLAAMLGWRQEERSISCSVVGGFHSAGLSIVASAFGNLSHIAKVRHRQRRSSTAVFLAGAGVVQRLSMLLSLGGRLANLAVLVAILFHIRPCRQRCLSVHSFGRKRRGLSCKARNGHYDARSRHTASPSARPRQWSELATHQVRCTSAFSRNVRTVPRDSTQDGYTALSSHAVRVVRGSECGGRKHRVSA